MANTRGYRADIGVVTAEMIWTALSKSSKIGNSCSVLFQEERVSFNSIESKVFLAVAVRLW